MPRGIYPRKQEQINKWRASRSWWKPTAEHREKIRAWATGRRHSDESKEKIRAANIGKVGCFRGKKRPPFSKEWIENLRKSHIGQTWSDESKRKLSESIKGHPNYLKEHSPETKRRISLSMGGTGTRQIRTLRDTGTYQYKQWRQSVFKRDGFRCQRCFTNGRLEADHIKQWAKFPELRFEISNGITLCRSCHKIKTKEQYAESRR